jgi:hypothetical protein
MTERIIVPQRQVQGGFDFKFETDPYDVKLHGIMTHQQYTTVISAVNKRLKRARAGAIDGVLLVTGPLILPLAVWGIRHRNQTRRRKQLLKKATEEFHLQNPALLMRWIRRPHSILTIERRPVDLVQVPQQQQQATPNEPMAHAELMEEEVVVQAQIQAQPTTTGLQQQQQQQQALPQRRQRTEQRAAASLHAIV